MDPDKVYIHMNKIIRFLNQKILEELVQPPQESCVEFIVLLPMASWLSPGFVRQIGLMVRMEKVALSE